MINELTEQLEPIFCGLFSVDDDQTDWHEDVKIKLSSRDQSNTSPGHSIVVQSNPTVQILNKEENLFEIFFAFLFRQTPKQDDINATSP